MVGFDRFTVFNFKKMKKINKFLRKNLPVTSNWFKLEVER